MCLAACGKAGTSMMPSSPPSCAAKRKPPPRPRDPTSSWSAPPAPASSATSASPNRRIPPMRDLSFDRSALAAHYDAGGDPVAVALEALRRAQDQARLNGWILLRDEADLAAEAEALKARDRAHLPLYGVPFA